MPYSVSGKGEAYEMPRGVVLVVWLSVCGLGWWGLESNAPVRAGPRAVATPTAGAEVDSLPYPSHFVDSVVVTLDCGGDYGYGEVAIDGKVVVFLHGSQTHSFYRVGRHSLDMWGSCRMSAQ